MLVRAIADLQKAFPDLVSEGLRFGVVGSKVNDRLGFDFRGEDKLLEEFEQIGVRADRPTLSFWNVTKSPSWGNLESEESVHDDRKLL